MEPFSIPLETIYLYGLIISGILTFFYVLFADVFHFHGAGDGLDFLNPVLIFAFVTILSASGYLFERLSSLHYLLILVFRLSTAFIVVSLLNVFVLVPLSSAEESLVYTESDLQGRIGTVITPIPADGFGEVMIESTSGRIAKPASSFDGEDSKWGSVLVVHVKNGVLQVAEHHQLERYFYRRVEEMEFNIIWIVIGIVVLILIALIGVFITKYRTAGPDEALDCNRKFPRKWKCPCRRIWKQN